MLPTVVTNGDELSCGGVYSMAGVSSLLEASTFRGMAKKPTISPKKNTALTSPAVAGNMKASIACDQRNCSDSHRRW